MVTRLVGILTYLKRRVDSEEHLEDNAELSRQMATEADNALLDQSMIDRATTILSQQAWKQAEEETLAMMFKIVNKSKRSDYLSGQDFLDFPRIELEIIDRLWRKYSDEKFGFSVQKKIWIEIGGGRGVVYYHGRVYSLDQNTLRKFGEKLGWRREIDKENWSFDLTNNLIEAPQGHRPCLIMGSPSDGDGIDVTGLISLYSSLNYEEQE